MEKSAFDTSENDNKPENEEMKESQAGEYKFM